MERNGKLASYFSKRGLSSLLLLFTLTPSFAYSSEQHSSCSVALKKVLTRHLFLSLLGGGALIYRHTSEEDEDTLAEPSHAGLQIIGDSEEMFVSSREHIKKLACRIDGKGGLFSIPQDNYKELLSEKTPVNLESIAQSIEELLQKISLSKEPNLYLFLDSHGSKKGFCIEGKESLPYEKIFQIVQDKVLKHNPQTNVHIFINACLANSGLKGLIRVAASTNGSYKNGVDGGKYQLKVNYYAAANSDKYAYGDIFWESVESSGLKPAWPKVDLAKGNFACETASDFLVFDGQNTHNMWSSYQKYDHAKQEYTPMQITEFYRERTNDTLAVKDSGESPLPALNQ